MKQKCGLIHGTSLGFDFYFFTFSCVWKFNPYWLSSENIWPLILLQQHRFNWCLCLLRLDWIWGVSFCVDLPVSVGGWLCVCVCVAVCGCVCLRLDVGGCFWVCVWVSECVCHPALLMWAHTLMVHSGSLTHTRAPKVCLASFTRCMWYFGGNIHHALVLSGIINTQRKENESKENTNIY